ncbi:hypothetical protein Tco_1570937 [Tanacetum coccineum]
MLSCPVWWYHLTLSELLCDYATRKHDDAALNLIHSMKTVGANMKYDIVVTNGWNAILRELDIAHLAAKVIVVGTRGFGHFGTRCEGELKKIESGKARTSLDPPWSDLELYLSRSVALNGGGWWEVTANKGGDGGAFVCLVAKGARSVALNGGGWWEVTANKGGDGGAFVCLVAKGGNGGACMLAW